VTVYIPATGERVEMRLSQDVQSGMLYLQVLPSGVATYSLQSVLDMGWRLLESNPDERALLKRRGVEIEP
jgi:hypothetical protein